MRKRIYLLMAVIILSSLFLFGASFSALAQDPAPAPIELSGQAIFFDEGLSEMGSRPCTVCHLPHADFKGWEALMHAREDRVH